MLTEIRERATGWIAWIIVFIISIPFALWGINEYFSVGGSLDVAEVNGQEIDQQAYRYALEERRSMVRRVLGSQFDADAVNSIEFKTAVLDDLIMRQLLNQDAESAGFRVGDEQLAQYIKTSPQFQRDGEFDSAAYQQAVQSLGYTKVGFESYLRQQNILQQIQLGLRESAFITRSDISQLLELAAEQRIFDYVIIKPEAFLTDIQISPDEIKARYDSNPESYTSPETVKIDYVQLSIADLEKEVVVTEQDIQRYFDDNRDRYRTPPQRTASHILITVPEDADEAAVSKALETAQSLADRVRGGEDFAELAKANSEDPGSAAMGGDLGLIEPGVMVKPFEDALFAMQEGEVSDPVRTRFGYHVIKLTKLIPEQGKELSEVREEIERDQRNKLAEELFIDRAETFRNLVFEQPESLQPVVEELGLKLQTSDWFSPSAGTGIAANPKIRDAAFSDDVYIDNLNSEAIELDVDTLVSIHMNDSKPASVKSLEEVRDQIEADLKKEKAWEMGVSKGERLVADMEGGGEWDVLVAGGGLQAAQTTQTHMQSDPEPSAEVNAAVFRAASPEPGPVYGGVEMKDHGYVVFRLTEVRPGDPANAREETRQEFTQALSRRRGDEYFLGYQRGLRESADVEIFEENM